MAQQKLHATNLLPANLCTNGGALQRREYVTSTCRTASHSSIHSRPASACRCAAMRAAEPSAQVHGLRARGRVLIAWQHIEGISKTGWQVAVDTWSGEAEFQTALTGTIEKLCFLEGSLPVRCTEHQCVLGLREELRELGCCYGANVQSSSDRYEMQISSPLEMSMRALTTSSLARIVCEWQQLSAASTRQDSRNQTSQVRMQCICALMPNGIWSAGVRPHVRTKGGGRFLLPGPTLQQRNHRNHRNGAQLHEGGNEVGRVALWGLGMLLGCQVPAASQNMGQSERQGSKQFRIQSLRARSVLRHPGLGQKHSNHSTPRSPRQAASGAPLPWQRAPSIPTLPPCMPLRHLGFGSWGRGGGGRLKAYGERAPKRGDLQESIWLPRLAHGTGKEAASADLSLTSLGVIAV